MPDEAQEQWPENTDSGISQVINKKSAIYKKLSAAIREFFF